MSNPVGAQRYGLGGGDAYYDAVKYGGYTGTREQFGRDQAEFAQNATAVAQAKEEVEQNTQTVVNTAQTFTEETVPAAIQSVEEKGDTEEDRLEARTTELVEAVNTAGAVQVQAVRDEGTTQIGLVSGAGTAQVEAVEQAGSDQVNAVELAGSTQVENVNNAGTTQVGNVNQAGTTQVGNVNTAGAAQAQIVENKGVEVRNSIPSDYTEFYNDFNNSVPYEVYDYTKNNLRTGSLQPNTAVSNDTNCFALKEKIPLVEGKTIVITPAVHADMAKWGCRVVAYTNPEMTTSVSGTIKVNNFNITAESISYTQESGFSYVLIGIYYFDSNGDSYTNVSEQFADNETIINVTTNDERKKIVFQEEYQETVEEVNTLSNNMDDVLSEFFLYSPISFTAIAGARGSASVYSEQTFYRVELPVSPGEKYHIKTATTNATVFAVGVFKEGYTNGLGLVSGTASGFVDSYITIPDEYSILVINSGHRYSVTIEKYMGLKSSLESIYPSYFQTEIDDTVTKTRGFCEEKALVFAVITDSHINSLYGTQVWDDTVKNILKFNEAYQIDGLVHLGDIINGTDTKIISTSELDRVRNSLQTLKNTAYLEGNHDTNTFYGNSMDDPITEAEIYSDVFRQNATEIIRPNGKLYGYRDFDNLGIRVIYLHSSAGDGTHGGQAANWKYPDDELTWVQNTALDTDYQVLLLSHMPLTEGTISTNATLPTNGNALKAIVDAFIDGGGVVIGLLYGHVHYDYMYNNGKFYETSIGSEDYSYTASETSPSASYAPATAIIPARMRYTVTQDLWDVVIVRPVSRTVKFVRFGAGTDRAYSY